MQNRYQAQENFGHYTFDDGRVVDTNNIAVYGIEASPFIRETDADCCEVGTMEIMEDDEWRDATDEELEEINGDRMYMEDLVWSIIEELTD